VGERKVGAGTLELIAPAVGPGRSPGARLLIPRVVGANPRDLCVITVSAGLSSSEGDESCDVRARGQAAVFVFRPGVPAALGEPRTVVAGIAGPDVTRVELVGPSGRRVLPLSADRGFLALYARRARGPLRVIARTATGRASVRRFMLPLRGRAIFARHVHRRPGAVFNDEVGENILRTSEAGRRRRFGTPAAVCTQGAVRCVFYAVVGQGHRGWRFTFAADGRMIGAGGGQPIPDPRVQDLAVP
jgi:hypothetical protein